MAKWEHWVRGMTERGLFSPQFLFYNIEQDQVWYRLVFMNQMVVIL